MPLSSSPDSSAGHPIAMPLIPVSGAKINLLSDPLSQYKRALIKALLIENEKNQVRTEFSSREQWEAIIVDPTSGQPTKYYFYLSHLLERRSENNYDILGENEPLPPVLNIDVPEKTTVATRVLGRISIDVQTDTIHIKPCNHLIIKKQNIIPADLSNDAENAALFSLAVTSALQSRAAVYFEANKVQHVALNESIDFYFMLTQSVLCYTTNGLAYDHKKSILGYRIAIITNEGSVASGTLQEKNYDACGQLIPQRNKRFQLELKGKNICGYSAGNEEAAKQAKMECDLRKALTADGCVYMQAGDQIFLVRNRLVGKDVRSRLIEISSIVENDLEIDQLIKCHDLLQCVEQVALLMHHCLERSIVNINFDLSNLWQLDSGEIVVKNYVMEAGDKKFATASALTLGRILEIACARNQEKSNTFASLSQIYQDRILLLINKLLNEPGNDKLNIKIAIDIIREIRFSLRLSIEETYHHAVLKGTYTAANQVFWQQREFRGIPLFSPDVENNIEKFKNDIANSLSAIGVEFLGVNLNGILFLNNAYKCKEENAQFILHSYDLLIAFVDNLQQVNNALPEFIPAAESVYSHPKLLDSRNKVLNLHASLSIMVDNLLQAFLSIEDNDREGVKALLASQELEALESHYLAILYFFSTLFSNDDVTVLMSSMQATLSVLHEVEDLRNDYIELDDSLKDGADHSLIETMYSWLLNLKHIAEEIQSSKEDFESNIDHFNEFVVKEVVKNEDQLISYFLEIAEFKSLSKLSKRTDVISTVNAVFDDVKNYYSWYKQALEALGNHQVVFNEIKHFIIAQDICFSIQERINNFKDILFSVLARYHALMFDLDAIAKLVNETIPSDDFKNMMSSLWREIQLLKASLSAIVIIDPTNMKADENALVSILMQSNIDFIAAKKRFIVYDKSRIDTQPFVTIALTHPILKKSINQIRYNMVIGHSLDINSLCKEFDSVNDYNSVAKAYFAVGELNLNNDLFVYSDQPSVVIDLVNQLNPTNLSSLQNRFLNYILGHEALPYDKFYPQGLQSRLIKFGDKNANVFFTLTCALQWRLHTREHHAPHCFEIVGDFVGAGSFVSAAYRSKGLLDPQADGSLRFGQSHRIIKYVSFNNESESRIKEMLVNQYQLSLLIPYLDEKPLVYLRDQCVMIETWLDDELLSNILKRQQSGLMFDTDQWLAMARGILLNAIMFSDLNIVHNDLKPDNVVCGERRARAFDFGLSSVSNVVPPKTSGTPLYMAPEKFRKGEKLTSSIDDFAVGLVLKCFLQAIPIQQSVVNDVYAYLAVAIDCYIASINNKNFDSAAKIEQAVNAVLAANPLFNKGINLAIPAQFQSFFRQYREVCMLTPEQFTLNLVDGLLAQCELMFSRTLAPAFQKLRLSISNSGITSSRSIIVELNRFKEYSHRQNHQYLDRLIHYVSTNANQLRQDRINEILKPIQKLFDSSMRGALSSTALSNAAAECKSTHFSSPLSLTSDEQQLLLNILNGLTESNAYAVDRIDREGKNIARRMTAFEAFKKIDDLLFNIRLRKLDQTNTGLLVEVQKARDLAYSLANELFSYRTVKIGQLPSVFFDKNYEDSFFSRIHKLKALANHPEVIAEVIATLDIEYLRSQVFTSVDEIVVSLERVFDCYLKQNDELLKLATALREDCKKCSLKQGPLTPIDALIRRVAKTMDRAIDEKSFFSVDNLVYLNLKVAKAMVKIKTDRAQAMLTLMTSNPAGSPVLVSRCSETLHSPRKETPTESPRQRPILGGS